MWIDQLSIRGFRGFNDLQALTFHRRLTVIYAPNSYGKTSISEAIECLLYGTTSKLDHADSKEEYRGSLRNSHLPEEQTPEIEATFRERETTVVYRSELIHDDSIQRTIDGKQVESWPVQAEIEVVARPFILQHTLKELLLAKPSERFEGIAHLIGFNALDQIQRDVASFCTKPDTHIPSQVQDLRLSVSRIEKRLQSQSSLARITKAYRKGFLNWTTIISLIYEEAHVHVSSNTTDKELLLQLQKQRDDAVGRIFSGHLDLHAYSELERKQLHAEGQYFLGCFTSKFVTSYAQLIGLETNKALNERIHFLGLGIQLLSRTPEACPLCRQPVTTEHHRELHIMHEQLRIQQQVDQVLSTQRTKIAHEVRNLRTRLEQDQNKHTERLAPLITLATDTDNLKNLVKVLGEVHSSDILAIRKAVADIMDIHDDMLTAFNNAKSALDAVESSLNGERRVEETLMSILVEKLVTYVSMVKNVIQAVNKHAVPIHLAAQALKYELDRLAGTEDISILIDLLNQREIVAKKLEIDAVLDRLKDFRKSVDKFVTAEIENAVVRALTEDVSTWYNKIRTTTDPDVHFGGFDLERTMKGEARARRVRINATSYGKDLASAVSSLSESKLNMLGISISIAMNMRYTRPFEFLVIDDPIQSLDAEHEAQFVEVIRELVEQGKQVILLSHNKHWVDAVRNGCRTINGQMYEITGYNQAGPCISEKNWASQQERFNEIDAILNDQMADSIRLQQAEEEIRILVCELTAKIAWKIHERHVSPSTLNAAQVRKILIECNIASNLIDRIAQTFSTTDSAHHAAVDYAPNRQRIQRYCSYLKELGQVLKNAKPAPAPSKILPVQRKHPAQPDVIENSSNTTDATIVSPAFPLTNRE